MFLITYVRHSETVTAAVDGNNLHNFLNLLESTTSVDRYSISNGNVLTKSALEYTSEDTEKR